MTKSEFEDWIKQFDKEYPGASGVQESFRAVKLRALYDDLWNGQSVK